MSDLMTDTMTGPLTDATTAPRTIPMANPMTNHMTVDISNRKTDAMTDLTSDPRFKTSKIKRELEILMSGQFSSQRTNLLSKWVIYAIVIQLQFKELKYQINN